MGRVEGYDRFMFRLGDAKNGANTPRVGWERQNEI